MICMKRSFKCSVMPVPGLDPGIVAGDATRAGRIQGHAGEERSQRCARDCAARIRRLAGLILHDLHQVTAACRSRTEASPRRLDDAKGLTSQGPLQKPGLSIAKSGIVPRGTPRISFHSIRATLATLAAREASPFEARCTRTSG